MAREQIAGGAPAEEGMGVLVGLSVVQETQPPTGLVQMFLLCAPTAPAAAVDHMGMRDRAGLGHFLLVQSV